MITQLHAFATDKEFFLLVSKNIYMNLNFTNIILLTSFAVGCATKAEKKEPVEFPEVPVIQLHTTDTSLNKNYVADIQAVKNVEIRARSTWIS